MYLKTNKSSTLISYVVDDGPTEKLLELGWQNLLGEPKPTAVFCINSTKWMSQILSSSSPTITEPEPDIFMLISDGSVHKITYEEQSTWVQIIDELQWYSTEVVSKPNDWELRYDFEIQNLKEILDKIKLEKSPYYFGTVAYTTDKDSIITTTRGKRGDGFCEIIRVDHRQRKIYATEKATLNAPFLEMLSYEFALYGGKVILHGHEQLEDAETLPYIFDGTTQCFNIIDYIRTNKLKTFNIKNHGYYKLFSSFDDAKAWLNNIKTINQTIANFEESLIEYKKELDKCPDSTFYTGLVKNTEEYIEELKVELNKKRLDDISKKMEIDWTKYNEFFPDRYLKKSNIDTQIEDIFSNLKAPEKFFDLTFDLDIGEKITALDIGGNEGTEQLKMADEAYFLDPFVPKPEWYKKQLTWEDIFSGNYKFNLIVAKNSINYLDKEQLKILPKLLKPGGVFIANTFVNPNEINREFINSRSGKKGIERSEYRDGKIFHYLDVDGITIEHWFYYYSTEDYDELFEMQNNPEIIYASFTSFQDSPNSIIIKIKTK